MSEPITRACVVHGKPAEARHGLLCTAHFDRLADMLREIEDEAAMLSAVPSMAIRMGSGSGSLASERAPAKLDMTAVLDPRTRQWTPDEAPRYEPLPPKQIGPWCLFCDHETCKAWRAGRRRDLHDDELEAGSAGLMSAVGVLGGWERILVEERSLTVGPEPVTVSSARKLLSRHLDWLAEQPFIDEMFNELRELLGLLRDLNKTKPAKPMSRCVIRYPEGLCGGDVWEREEVRVVDTVSGRWALTVPGGPAVCDICGARWETDADKARLKLMIEQEHDEKVRPKTEDGRRMLTVEELAKDLRTTVNAVRIIVSRKRIPNVKGHYDPDHFAHRYGKASA